MLYFVDHYTKFYRGESFQKSLKKLNLLNSGKLDISKIKELGYSPKIDVEKGAKLCIIDIPVDSVTKKRECIDRDYRTKGNQIIGNLCNFYKEYMKQNNIT